MDMDLVPDRDLEIARQLPDEFLYESGEPLDRVVQLANRHWSDFDYSARADLVQALLPVMLDMLADGAGTTTVHRRLCEAVVAVWRKRQRLEQRETG
jgi:hypothetical protein